MYRPNFTPIMVSGSPPSNRWQQGLIWGWVPRGQHIKAWGATILSGHYDFKDRKQVDTGPTFLLSPTASQGGYTLKTTAANNRLYWQVTNTSNDTWDQMWWLMNTVQQLTMSVQVELTAAATFPASVISARNSTGVGNWMMQLASSTSLAFTWRGPVSNQTVTWSSLPTFAANTYYSFVMNRKAGGVYELFINGKSYGTKTNSAAFTAGNGHDLTLGALATNADSCIGVFYSAYIWKHRVLANSDALALYSDPWTVVRSADWLAAPYFLGGAGSIFYPALRMPSMAGRTLVV